MRSASEGASRGPARLSAAAAAMEYLPVFLRLDGHPVVVVGGGTVALRKAAWLRRAGARVTVVAPGVHAQIEALLPGRLGALARFMGARRSSVQRALGAFARRGFWERVASGPVATQVLRGDAAQAERALGRELLAARLTAPAEGAGARRGEVYLIGAGPGDPDLLTLRALQLLQRADVILYDRLVGEEVL